MIGSIAYAEGGPQAEAVGWAWGGQMELHKAEQVARSQYNKLLETEDEALAAAGMASTSAIDSNLEQAAECAEPVI